MNRGLYIGATSLINNQRKMDVLSNNLANINTTGFKKDFSVAESFPEKLLIKQTRNNERRQGRAGDILEFQELDQGKYRARIEKDRPLGNGQTTRRSGEGFFKVETPNGISHVKEIEFSIDEDGYLKTSYNNLYAGRTAPDNDDGKRYDYENYILDNNGNRIQVQAGQANMEEVIDRARINPRDYVVGTMSAGVNFKRVHTDFSQGGIIDTEGKLDLALLGDGFFKLEDGEDIVYTRSGSFSLDTENYLIDLDGRRVLSTNGPIQINGSDVSISEDGRILVDGDNAGQLDIVSIANNEFLRKVGDSNYRMAMANGELIPAEEGEFEGRVLQGHLESSNMDAVTGMVEMISLMRDFEANQKLVRMQDEMLEKAATEIGRV